MVVSASSDEGLVRSLTSSHSAVIQTSVSSLVSGSTGMALP